MPLVADFFDPYRFVTSEGARVRYDPSGANVLLGDYDVLTQVQTDAWTRVVAALAGRSPFVERLERATSDYLAAKKSRSGTKWTEQDYRDRGIELLHLRLKPEQHGPLDELAALWGVSRGEATKRAIDEAHARHVAPYARRGQLEQPADESHVRPADPLDKRSGASKTDKSK